MARKLKIKSPERHMSLFDMPELTDISAIDSMPIHPLISEYAQRSASESTDSAEAPDPDVEMKSIPSIDTGLLFMSFGSGSSGNCAYIGTHREGVLIDAGVDPTTVKEALKTHGINPDAVKGICLTHDHSDHVRYVYSMVRKHPSVGVFCTPKTLNGLLRRHNISRRIKDYHRPIYKEFEFTVGGIEITAFDVSHDGTDNAGFFLQKGDHTFAIATDLGCITPRVDYYMRMARYIMIESNYDTAMLMTGSYPQHLKARIAAERGHLDNADTASFLASCASPRLSNIFLCHLSQDNNTPELAIKAVKDALIEAGVKGVGDGSDSLESRDLPIQLVALPRYGASQLFILR
ncbi:MAG: MBL fold metallo-hydrolase [Muribaculaceae bacterium]|nr:MBL fold metallo-hydrolase [Muribaculaceae bacterium]